MIKFKDLDWSSAKRTYSIYGDCERLLPPSGDYAYKVACDNYTVYIDKKGVATVDIKGFDFSQMNLSDAYDAIKSAKDKAELLSMLTFEIPEVTYEDFITRFNRIFNRDLGEEYFTDTMHYLQGFEDEVIKIISKWDIGRIDFNTHAKNKKNQYLKIKIEDESVHEWFWRDFWFGDHVCISRYGERAFDEYQ